MFYLEQLHILVEFKKQKHFFIYLSEFYYTVENKGLVESLFSTIYDDQIILKILSGSNFQSSHYISYIIINLKKKMLVLIFTFIRNQCISLCSQNILF